MSVPALEFKKVSKFFGEVRANTDISFFVERGAIHAIVGENGAGKSTAMKILFGMYRPDEGEVFVNGQQVHFHSPIDAMAAKIGMVHQHFMLAEPFTALDNILLQQKGSAFSLLPRASQKNRLEEIAHRYGFQINLDAKVEDLSVGEQQRLEILKILSQDSEILILDEPTAVLTPQEVQDLFANLRRLREEGKTILIITHKLKEVMALTDSVTVFRAGHVVGHKWTRETNAEELAEMMVGRRIQKPQERNTAVDQAKTVLHFESVSGRLGSHGIDDIKLSVHAREIVGVAGVEGNGQDVLIRALLDKQALEDFTGKVTTLGSVGSFPEDRLRFGVLPSRPVYENFILGQHKSLLFAKGLFLKTKEILQRTKDIMNKYDIRPHNAHLPFDKMSGGNQQKLVVARALLQNPQVIIAAQPTRGVDIGAIEFIHNELRKSRDEGAGILLISSELDELMALSDRIVVLYKGRLVKEFTRAQFDEIALGKAMGCGN
ncbi:sugar ABC transporter ATP-binding protein [Bdellovibrio bacteriovorus]|uniref:Sugar ABC transporter ATP-binding protein n=1 Tax=Bdellovibrio bacteriovorus TaxID=959 RepID=A0A150WTR5_BDEBC|nr:ABC transporter ATP-binding protein [Bdellovibrio bacteriovorus]KYG67684.1 sugar ABC transporter ATP-binding protein [Bdellovibrio bacteriovorus]